MHLPVPNSTGKIEYVTKKQLFKHKLFKQQINPIYLKACDFFGAVLIDRTNTLDSGLNFNVLDPIDLVTNTDKSFSEICAIRASQIVDQSKLDQFTILWSGGIDSTVALIALYQELQKRDQLTRLQVLYSQESIDEFPGFFNHFIGPNIQARKLQSTIYDSVKSSEVNITGEHGDQLFGSDKLHYWVESGEAYRPYTDILEYVISRKLATDKYTVQLIDYIEPQLAYSPIPLNTLYDYLWWMNFSLKWQNVSLRLLYGLEEGQFKLHHNLVHFFQSVEFQNWSISNHDKKIKSTWNSYKYVAKEYIHAFYPDEEYLNNKEKEQSLKQVIVRPKKRFFFF